MADTNTFQLSSEFGRANESEWLALLDKALKGRSVDTLSTKTYDDLTIKALYRDTDWQSSTDSTGLPGQYPFIRGSKPSSDPFLPWDIRQLISYPAPNDANQSILSDLEHGVSSIDLRIDEDGERGVCIRTLSDLEKTLKGVKLDWAPIGIEVTGASIESGKATAAMLAAFAKANSDDTNSLKLAFNYDPIGCLARSGHLSGDLAQLKEDLADCVQSLSKDFKCSTFLRADGRPVHEAGGSEAQELASLIASGTQYVRLLVESGVDAATAVSSINFTLAVGSDYLIEIAKIRAARRMWAKVALEFGVAENDFAMNLQAVSSRRMLTARDPWVNILRNTAACFAAGVGGADIVTIRAFTDALGLPSPQARRIARNTQIIAQEESFLGKVIDPSGGAWSIASISNELSLKAWEVFQSIEKLGGYLASILDGSFQQQVSRIRSNRLIDVAYRKVQITGVSDYPQLEETPARFVTPDVETVTSQATQPTGKKPTSYSMADLSAESKNGLTLKDLTQINDDVLETDPFWPMRLAKPFENLRDYAEKFETKNNIKPKVFLAALGPLSEHTARTSFATNFFAAGGLVAEYHTGTTEELAISFQNSGCSLACLCGSDERYLQEAADTARELGAAGVARLYLAGKPPLETKDAWQEAGVDEFIHIGVDVVASLELAHSELGLAL